MEFTQAITNNCNSLSTLHKFAIFKKRALLYEGMKIKSLISQTPTLCAFAPCVRQKSLHPSATPKVLLLMSFHIRSQ